MKNFIRCLQGGLLHFFYATKKKKIFVIGLSRTGTLSITTALRMLGLEGHHFPGVCFMGAKPLWLKGPTLKDNVVFSDISVIPFYKYYSRKFPNSLFILTTRDRDKWLESLGKKPNLTNKNIYNNNHEKLREFIYGSFKFSEEEYSLTYDQHYQDVISFFANSMERLLIVNIPQGDGWDKICPFLGAEIPEFDFPHRNKGYQQ